MSIVIKEFDNRFEEISELCEKFRHAVVESEIEDELGPYYSENYVKFLYGLLKYKVGAFKDNRLIGVIGSLSFNGLYLDKKVKVAGMGRIAVDPEFWDTNLKNDLIDFMIKKLADEGHDLIYSVLLKKADKFDIELLENKGFNTIKGRKNSEAYVKILGRDGLDLIKKTRGMNALEYQAAKLVCGIKDAEIDRGKIKDGKEGDYDQIIELLNNFSKEFPLSRIWTKQEFKEFMDKIKNINKLDFSDIKKDYPDTPYGHHFKVWEDNNEILGFALYYIFWARMTKEPVPLGNWVVCAFSSEVEPDEAKAFLSTLFRELKGTAAVINCELPYYAKKVFGKTGFMGDQRAVNLMIKPLTDKVEGIFEEKIKEYYLSISGFNI
jgi:hypothetical protein